MRSGRGLHVHIDRAARFVPAQSGVKDESRQQCDADGKTDQSQQRRPIHAPHDVQRDRADERRWKKREHQETHRTLKDVTRIQRQRDAEGMALVARVANGVA